jgi:hypothetical protein
MQLIGRLTEAPRFTNNGENAQCMRRGRRRRWVDLLVVV